MADPIKFPLSTRPTRHTCAVHNNFNICRPSRRISVIVMLTLLVYLLQRKRAFAWSPAVDLSDPYVAAALAPMTHS